MADIKMTFTISLRMPEFKRIERISHKVGMETSDLIGKALNQESVIEAMSGFLGRVIDDLKKEYRKTKRMNGKDSS